MPAWVKIAIDAWNTAASAGEVHVFRPVNRACTVTSEYLGEKVVCSCPEARPPQSVFPESHPMI
jgi:hypothetical protein